MTGISKLSAVKAVKLLKLVPWRATIQGALQPCDLASRINFCSPWWWSWPTFYFFLLGIPQEELIQMNSSLFKWYFVCVHVRVCMYMCAYACLHVHARTYRDTIFNTPYRQVDVRVFMEWYLTHIGNNPIVLGSESCSSCQDLGSSNVYVPVCQCSLWGLYF
jgi:hypothetical protein